MFQKNSDLGKKMKKRGVSRLPDNIFLSHITKNFVGEQLCVSGKVCYEKNLSNRWGLSRASVGNFLSHNAENYWEPPYNVSENLGYRKNLCILVCYHDFLSNFFSLRIPQNFVGELSCVAEEFWFGNKYEKKGSITIFCRQFSVSHTEKLCG